MQTNIVGGYSTPSQEVSSPVMKQLDDMIRVNAEIQELLRALEVRMTPILRPVNTDTPPLPGVMTNVPMSPLGVMLQERLENQRSALLTLSSILSRLDV